MMERVVRILLGGFLIAGSMGIIQEYTVYAAEKLEIVSEDDSVNNKGSIRKSISGRLYEFDEENDYEFSTGSPISVISDSSQFGTFSLMGNMKSISDVNGFISYEVVEGNVLLTYELGDTLTMAPDTERHLIKDKTKKIDSQKIDDEILNGTIIVQTSLDGSHWVIDSVQSDIAGNIAEFNPNIYYTKAIQHINGCYYRIIVVYKTEKRLADTKIGFIPKKNYEYKRYAEIYEFYLIDGFENSGGGTSPDAIPRKELGKRINTGKNNGFSGEEAITDKDPHFGWDIGTFYVNGYTREGNEEGLFLKTLGDRITLWFNLTQDINCLNGKKNLSINEDKDGYDQYFGVDRTNFKHGTLIIQYTDYEGKAHTPIIYTNYLAANASTGANTKVELFEEGDYKVALDYEIKDSSGLDSYTDYRIAFNFKIRNANCMVYPFDVSTGDELADNALTEKGFKLDLAKSRYLTIDLVRNEIKKMNGRYFSDVRFNTAAQDGKEYMAEGEYTFTVKNPSTGESTTKKIYVGTDGIYKALADGRTIAEVNDLLEQGGEMQTDGSILMPVVEESEEIIESVVETTIPKQSKEENEKVVEIIPEKQETAQKITDSESALTDNHFLAKQRTNNQDVSVTLLIVAILVIILLSSGLWMRKKRFYKSANNIKEEKE